MRTTVLFQNGFMMQDRHVDKAAPISARRVPRLASCLDLIPTPDQPRLYLCVQFA